MKPTESVPSAIPVEGSRRRGPDVQRDDAAEESETEEQAFYAAQEVAFADLRAYHASRPRRKR
jgi:hypothetical protein